MDWLDHAGRLENEFPILMHLSRARLAIGKRRRCGRE
jgi:hypothetical protein